MLIKIIISALGLCFPVLSDLRAEEKALGISVDTAHFAKDDIGENFGQKSLGYGLHLNYDFAVKGNSEYGVDLGYRVFRKSLQMSQLVYGLTIKHKMFTLGSGTSMLIGYGLNVQNIRLEGVSESALAHDTKFLFELRTSEQWFLQLCAHISTLRYFGVEPKNMNYLSFGGGYRFTW